MDLLKPFKEVYPSYMLEIERANTTSVIVGICVFFILIVLQPFGLELEPWNMRFRDAFIFGIITTIFCRMKLLVMAYLLKKQIVVEEKWNLSSEIAFQIWFLFSLGIINWIVGHYMYGCAFAFSFFKRWQRETFSVGIFPLMSLVFLRQYNMLKTYSSKANNIEAKLSVASIRAITEKDNRTEKLTFSDDQTFDTALIDPFTILYLVAADNYIRIFYLENNSLKNLLVRSTLKSAEEKLTAYENFYRCHRSYLVNLNYLRHISGNATGYKLHLEGTDNLIPVSRNLNSEISDKINNILVA